MPYFNDINPNDYQEQSIWTDSLWIINERDKSGKHNNLFHGNFVPQVINQLLIRYTKKGDVVYDPFLGSGTTAIECERLERNCIGIDIQPNLIDSINELVNPKETFSKHIAGDSTDGATINIVKSILGGYGQEKVHFVVIHPPYYDIIKFSGNPKDLSNSTSLEEFRQNLKTVIKHSKDILYNNRHLAIVIGDKYTQGEWFPLAFYAMSDAQSLGLQLKSIVVKNMSGNRAKRNLDSIWRYRALTSDYYIFKHEYILIFKKI